jgi:hypothetical protein
VGAAKSFTYQTFKSEGITVMNRQILGRGLQAVAAPEAYAA